MSGRYEWRKDEVRCGSWVTGDLDVGATADLALGDQRWHIRAWYWRRSMADNEIPSLAEAQQIAEAWLDARAAALPIEPAVPQT